MKANRRTGFTLVELLVAIAIIGILIALLLPAVQAAREAGRRMQCVNHLKQLALACHNFHDAYKRFPSGGSRYDSPVSYQAPGQPHGRSKQQASWAFQILPYIEEQNTYQMLDYTKLKGTPIATYFCPSRRAPLRAVGGFSYGVVTCDQGLNDYACAVPGLFDGDIREVNEWYTAGIRDTYGVFNKTLPDTVDIVVAMSDIRDGTSKTILFAEKWLNTTRYERGDWGDCVGIYNGWCQDTARAAAGAPQPDGPVDVLFPNGRDAKHGMGSAHPGAMNAAIADGSVRSISYEIDATTFRLLSDRRDGQQIEFP